MKKLTALFLILTLAAALCACSATPPPNPEENILPKADIAAIRESYDKASAYIEATFKPEGMTVSEQDEDGGVYLYKYWSKENTDSTDFTNDIEIDGKTITIGETPVKDLEGLGFEISKGKETVEPNEITSVTLTKGNKTCVLSTADTMSDKAVPIDDTIVGAVSASFSDYSLPFTYSGLDSKSTPADVIDKLGTPNSTINLSSDNDGSIIELVYTKTSKEGDVVTDVNLLIDLRYDADKNDASISSVDISAITYKPES